jgi:hypothetical protein
MPWDTCSNPLKKSSNTKLESLSRQLMALQLPYISNSFMPPCFFLIIQWFPVERDATISLIVIYRVALMVS